MEHDSSRLFWRATKFAKYLEQLSKYCPWENIPCTYMVATFINERRVHINVQNTEGITYVYTKFIKR
jgi:hypothetical protein